MEMVHEEMKEEGIIFNLWNCAFLKTVLIYLSHEAQKRSGEVFQAPSKGMCKARHNLDLLMYVGSERVGKNCQSPPNRPFKTPLHMYLLVAILRYIQFTYTSKLHFNSKYITIHPLPLFLIYIAQSVNINSPLCDGDW